MCGHRVVRACVYKSIGYCPRDGSDIKNEGGDMCTFRSYLRVLVTVGMVDGCCLPGALLGTFALLCFAVRELN